MRFRFAVYAVACLVASACSVDRPTTVSLSESDVVASSTDEGSAAVEALGNAINAGLESSGATYRVLHAEWLGENEAGQTVFFSDRGNKQLGEDFVPGDPRRGGRTNITYIIDQVDGNTNDGLTAVQTSDAIQRAMSTWDNLTCSVIPIERLPDTPFDLGVVEFLNGWGGGSPFFLADITHAGWIAPGRLPPNVIAVTFTFIFVDAARQPTDIDNNKKLDVAFREIYYNDLFVWRINANVDVETIALHEGGHGLSQGHFGKAFLTTSNGKLHFAERAVMNAGYSGVQQEISATDNAGHCSNWAKWPNN